MMHTQEWERLCELSLQKAQERRERTPPSRTMRRHETFALFLILMLLLVAALAVIRWPL